MTQPHKLLVNKTAKLRRGKLYLRLYHGRKNPDEDMDDWGFNGPVFGPLTAVVMTYLSTIRLHGTETSDELWLDTMQDMVHWDGSYFGDFEIFLAGDADHA